ncbi:thiamine phosphate synthase [Natronoflexus pectinivorans]|nr:thiamine phosphate synthase [Natronoflexus pectinivorans]
MFITPNLPLADLVPLVSAYLEGGGRWLQLRLKDCQPDEIIYTAKEIKAMCKDAGALFILNDHPDIALKTQADGVHLGKNDMSVAQARDLLGSEFIIGGTANTVEDMISLAQSGVDYIGLGPFRFTSTKKNLSPIIGLEGYAERMRNFREAGFETPVTAIGGILPDDVEAIMNTGVNGIAVSGVLANDNDIPKITKRFISMTTHKYINHE